MIICERRGARLVLVGRLQIEIAPSVSWRTLRYRIAWIDFTISISHRHPRAFHYYLWASRKRPRTRMSFYRCSSALLSGATDKTHKTLIKLLCDWVLGPKIGYWSIPRTEMNNVRRFGRFMCVQLCIVANMKRKFCNQISQTVLERIDWFYEQFERNFSSSPPNSKLSSLKLDRRKYSSVHGTDCALLRIAIDCHVVYASCCRAYPSTLNSSMAKAPLLAMEVYSK